MHERHENIKTMFRTVLCVVALLCQSEAELRHETLANEAFAVLIDPADFGFTSNDGSEISYVVVSSSDWIQFMQKRLILDDSSLSPGLLYGTPRSSQKGTTTLVDITAFSSTQYPSVSKRMEIRVESGSLPQELYLFQLTTMNLFDFHQNSANKENFENEIKGIWSSNEEIDINIFQYFTYEEKGTRLSRPAPGQMPKEGMYIVAGPANRNAVANLSTTECSDGSLRDLPINYQSIDLDINWCSFQMVTIEPETNPYTGSLNTGYTPDTRPSDDDMDQLDIFLKTVVALLVVAIVLFLILAYIMCGRRKVTQAYEPEDVPDGSEVIVNKRAIQGASTKLRRIPVQPNWDTFVSKERASRVRPAEEPVNRKVLLHSDDEIDRPDSYRKSGMFSSDDDELSPKKSVPSYRDTPRYSSAESTLEKKPSEGRQPPAYVRPPLFLESGTVSPSMVDPHVSPDQPQPRHRPTTSYSSAEGDLGPAPSYAKPPSFGSERIVESEPQDV
ncbi:epsilon-sarcoglycan-like [Oscarella lobularis]|uniref:epsilon-sarcoglycan-like n=1 Tax=Oscarella lobularis TaxID=121494 RepID=UPI003313849B